MRKLLFIITCIAMFAVTAIDQTEVKAKSENLRVIKMSPESYKVSQELQLNIYTKLGLSEKEAFGVMVNSLENGTPIAVPIPVGFSEPSICCPGGDPFNCWPIPIGMCCWACK